MFARPVRYSCGTIIRYNITWQLWSSMFAKAFCEGLTLLFNCYFVHFLGNRAVFNRVDSYQGCVGLALLRSVIGPENLRHSLKQLDAKLNDLVTRVFSRFLAFSRVFPAL